VWPAGLQFDPDDRPRGTGAADRACGGTLRAAPAQRACSGGRRRRCQGPHRALPYRGADQRRSGPRGRVRNDPGAVHRSYHDPVERNPSMSQELFPYYERELLFIRQLAQEFAKQYPAAAGRLLLEPNRSADPHVERLIESFALLAGRIHHKLDDEFPELTDALLQVLYPHYLAPVPSMAVLQFDLDPARGQLPSGFLIPRRSRLQTAPLQGVPCKYQTAFPVTQIG